MMHAGRKESMWWALVLALALAWPLGLAAEERALVPVDLFMQARITIAPEGRITELAWMEKDKGKLGVGQVIEPTIRSLEFEPGAINGVPAVTETTLRMMLRATPTADGNWEIAIRGASTGALTEKMGPPQYPMDAAREGVEAEVLSEIDIDVAGRVTIASMDFESSRGGDAFRREFLRASEKAIAGWRFVPERVGGHAVTGRMRVPISYCLGGRAWCEARNLAAAAKGVAPNEPVPLDSVARLKTKLPGAEI